MRSAFSRRVQMRTRPSLRPSRTLRALLAALLLIAFAPNALIARGYMAAAPDTTHNALIALCHSGGDNAAAAQRYADWHAQTQAPADDDTQQHGPQLCAFAGALALTTPPIDNLATIIAPPPSQQRLEAFLLRRIAPLPAATLPPARGPPQEAA